MLKSISWPVVILVLGFAHLATLIFIGLPLFAISKGWVPPMFLFGPLGALLTAASVGAVAYMKGKNEIPNWATNPAAHALIASMRPPPPAPELEGVEVKVTIPPAAGVP